MMQENIPSCRFFSYLELDAVTVIDLMVLHVIIFFYQRLSQTFDYVGNSNFVKDKIQIT